MGEKITLACEVCNNRNYRVAKTGTDRLIVKKFCVKCNKHTLHKEEK